MKKRYVNLRGRNVYSCEPCPHFPKQSTKKDKFEDFLSFIIDVIKPCSF